MIPTELSRVRVALIACFMFGFSASAAAQTWTQIFPAGEPPGPRIGHSAVYDAANKRMIIFAGGLGGTLPPYNDTWVLTNADGTGASEWIQLFPAGPLPSRRMAHAVAYDPGSNRMIIVGASGVAPAPDLWVLTHANGLGGTPEWILLGDTSSVSGCLGNPSVAYDAGHKRLIALGACWDANLQPHFELWVVTNADGTGGAPVWTQLFPTGGSFHFNLGADILRLNYDEATNRLIAFGGATSTAGPFNTVWVLTNANGLGGTPEWIELAAGGAVPNQLPFATVVYDAARNRLIAYGGWGGDPPGGYWVYTHANGLGGTSEWIHIFPPVMPSIWHWWHASVYDPSSNRMTVFGGNSNEVPGGSDVWVLANANGIVNEAPWADAGSKRNVSCLAANGTQVMLDGSGSSDPDGDTLIYTWTGPFPEGGGTVTGVNPVVTLPLGKSTLTLVVNDGTVDSAPDTVEISVTVAPQGLLPPLAELALEGGLASLPGKAFKLGSTLPLKLRMYCGATALTDGMVAPPRIVGLTYAGDAVDLATIDPDAGESDDGGLFFRYSTDNWIYNLSTKALTKATYFVTLELPDGRRYIAGFVLR